jgi:undecaprenyl phosphate N,N'-diacetylbacillosamine 1-phosphate transferase
MSSVAIQEKRFAPMRGIARTCKHLFDFTFSLVALVVLSPLLFLIGLLIVVESGWPPLFTQTRIGQGGRRFRLFKFRTMVPGAETMGAGLFFEADDPRFNRIGKLLRSYSLDELPQLLNVLLGEESLVGPRAMVPYTADKLTQAQDLRHRVRPGITGWAQVNGRNTIPWSKRVELDNWYIDNWSLMLDLRIILRTFPILVSTEGVRLDQSAVDVDDLSK